MVRKLSNVRKKVLKLPSLRKNVRGIPRTESKKIAVIPAEGNGAEQGAASVDKIRAILFGSPIKGYEARFARLEDTLADETTEMKDTMHRHFDPNPTRMDERAAEETAVSAVVHALVLPGTVWSGRGPASTEPRRSAQL